MASKRRVRRKSCTGKIGHETAGVAVAAMKSVQRRRWYGPMNVYRCRFCSKYHIGHAGRRCER